MKNPINTPTKATTTRINITLIGDIFFLDIKNQQATINTAVNRPGNTESNLSCNERYTSPASFVNSNEVFTDTQVAATAPITTLPKIEIDYLNASPLAPIKKLTALAPKE